MNKKIDQIFLGKFHLLIGILLFTACSKKSEWQEDLSDIQLQVTTAKVANSGISQTWSNQGSFGLFIKPNTSSSFSQLLETNRQFTYNSSTNEFNLIGNPIYYPQTEAIDLIVYAPYQANITTTYPIDVSNQSDLKAIDFIYSNSTKNISKQNQAVALTFDHQFSKIVFNIQKKDGSSVGLENMQIEMLGFYNRADFDLSSGELINQMLSSAPITTGTAHEGIIIPNSGLANRKFKFILGTSEWEYTLPNSNTFEAGKVYNYLISINDKEITVNLSDIAPWVNNSNGIDDTGSISTNPIEYAYIPAGTFLMGAPDTASTIQNYEKPQHWVKISKSFLMSKYEITIAQYAEFLNATNIPYGGNAKIYHNIDNESTYLFYSKRESTPYFENNKWEVLPSVENYPMQGVTWHGALAYAQWKGATLPTEAQWEYAYRATTVNKFFTGNFGSEMMAYGYYYNNTGGYVKPVGEKKPNPWGLFDIAGNVIEWCLDGPEQYQIVSYPIADNELNPIIDPVGKISNSGHAYFRGGNYSASVQSASAYSRNSIDKEYSVWQIGFRIVINP